MYIRRGNVTIHCESLTTGKQAFSTGSVKREKTIKQSHLTICRCLSGDRISSPFWGCIKDKICV